MAFGASKTAKKVTETVTKNLNPTYGKVTKEAHNEGAALRNRIKEGDFQDAGLTDRLSRFMGQARGNLQENALDAGRTVLGQAAMSSVKGGIAGGAVGGTIEAAQGGSFWDGAKQGAFNGAVGMGAYRTGQRAVGAKSAFNPFKKQSVNDYGGLFSGASTMWRATGGKDVQISKQAVNIMNNTQRAGMNRAIMNGGIKVN